MNGISQRSAPSNDELDAAGNDKLCPISSVPDWVNTIIRPFFSFLFSFDWCVEKNGLMMSFVVDQATVYVHRGPE